MALAPQEDIAMATVTFHFYGERGLVNALLLDLEKAEQLLALLGRIEFHARTPSCLDCSWIEAITVLVEAGFGGFGWPDALFVATGQGRRLCVFLEAKATTYELAAADYTAQKRQFNSKINGQFTLKHRLVSALPGYTAGSDKLAESELLSCAYGEARPRHLQKWDNLRHVVDPYLAGLTAEQCLFAALTDDATNPWPMIAATHPELLPFLCDPLPDGATTPTTVWEVRRNTWTTHAARFGWIGFRTIEAELPIGARYQLARHFLEAERKRTRRRERGEGIPNFPRPEEWDAYRGRATIALRDRLRERGEALLEGTGFTYDPQKGSDSIRDPHGYTVMKVITPRLSAEFPDADLYLGVQVPNTCFDGAAREALQVKTFRFYGVVFDVVGIEARTWSEERIDQLFADMVADVLGDV
jgi:hypothetical protein